MIITRLASNSFQLKGWSVVLTSAIMAVSAKDAETSFVALAYFPAIVFWLLDGYYLWQERIFRLLYGDVAATAIESINFSMKPPENHGETWSSAVFSKTVISFHMVIILSILTVMLTSNF